MQILLSCAKDMTPVKEVSSDVESIPVFQKDAERHMSVLSGLTEAEIMELMKVSAAIAALNRRRYAEFSDPRVPSGQAALSYTGMAYRHLKAGRWSEDDSIYANSHLWITSFLYGLLRPMDMIRPYRLEGNVRLHGRKTMFEYWKPLLTGVLIPSVKNDDGILVHLATEEMTRLFDWHRITDEVQVIVPEFLSSADGRERVITVHAKMCRGAMADFIIRNRITSPEELKMFSYDGYAYDRSSGNTMTFVR